MKRREEKEQPEFRRSLHSFTTRALVPDGSLSPPMATKAEKDEIVVNQQWLNSFALRHWNMDVKYVTYTVEELKALLDELLNNLKAQSSLVEIRAPVFVFGDLHGQMTDLRRLLVACGQPAVHRFLFLGDYVDRGQHSLEVISLLFAYRLLFPGNVFLLRGNHELKHINKVYGFHEDIKNRFKDPKVATEVYEKFNTIFSWLPLSAVVSDKILCMHGGLSRKLTSLDDLRKIERPIVSPKGDIAQDILWSDPVNEKESSCTTWTVNKLRACAELFGKDAVDDIFNKLGVKMLIRAHQVFPIGYRHFFNDKVLTVFSASRYQDDLWNYAAVVEVQNDLSFKIIQIKPHDFELRHCNKKDEVTMDGPDDEEKKDEAATAVSPDKRAAPKKGPQPLEEKTMRGRSERGKTMDEDETASKMRPGK